MFFGKGTNKTIQGVASNDQYLNGLRHDDKQSILITLLT